MGFPIDAQLRHSPHLQTLVRRWALSILDSFLSPSVTYDPFAPSTNTSVLALREQLS